MQYLLLTGVSALVLLFAACGGDGETDLTDREITDDDLALMVLPQAEFGSDYKDFQFSENSGFKSNEDEIAEAIDKNDEREDIERFGRVNGYSESYDSQQALPDEPGVFSVGSAVRFYRDADGASEELADRFEDSRRNLGMTSEGVTLEDIQEFDVADLGEEAIGAVLIVSVKESGQELTLYSTGVLFRRGRLLGSAFFQVFGDEDVQAEVTALARTLDERIRAVLRGDMVSRPSPAATPRTTPRRTAGVTATPSPGITRPDPETLVPAGYALDQSLDVSLDESEAGQIVVVSHTIRRDKAGNLVVDALPQDCPVEPVAGSPCAFRIEVFSYDDATGWVSRYVDDHGNQFVGAEQGLTVESFTLSNSSRQALILTSDRATGVGSGTGPVQIVLSMEQDGIRVVYQSDVKASFGVDSGVAVITELDFSQSEAFAFPSGHRITRVGLDTASGEVRVLDQQIVPLEQ